MHENQDSGFLEETVIQSVLKLLIFTGQRYWGFVAWYMHDKCFLGERMMAEVQQVK